MNLNESNRISSSLYMYIVIVSICTADRERVNKTRCIIVKTVQVSTNIKSMQPRRISKAQKCPYFLIDVEGVRPLARPARAQMDFSHRELQGKEGRAERFR
jgi:hypothetical protein